MVWVHPERRVLGAAIMLGTTKHTFVCHRFCGSDVCRDNFSCREREQYPFRFVVFEESDRSGQYFGVFVHFSAIGC